MNEGHEWQTERTVSGAVSSELLIVCASDVSKRGEVRCMLVDRSSQRLNQVDWLPGKGLKLRQIDLERELPQQIFGATLHQHRLIFSDDHPTVHAVNCNTGSVARIENLPQPVVLAPDGRTLVAATDWGLVTTTLWGDPDGPIIPGEIEPLLVKPLHPSTSIVIPGPDHNNFQLGIGCHGWVEMVRIALDPYDEVDRPPAVARGIGTPLPMDPHDILNPAATGPRLPSSRLFVMDDGGTGLISIDPDSSKVDIFKTRRVGYGSVRWALPSLDWSTCLVELRGGDTVIWSPDSRAKMERITPTPGRLLLWQGDRALAIDDTRFAPILRDVPVVAER